MFMLPGYYNESALYYFSSIRAMPYVFIGVAIGSLYAMMILGYALYQLYWCMMWESNEGKSRWSMCVLPEPGTTNGA